MQAVCFSKATFPSISMTSDAVLSEAKKTETTDVETQVGKQHWWGYHLENHAMNDSEKRNPYMIFGVSDKSY